MGAMAELLVPAPAVLLVHAHEAAAELLMSTLRQGPDPLVCSLIVKSIQITQLP